MTPTGKDVSIDVSPPKPSSQIALSVVDLAVAPSLVISDLDPKSTFDLIVAPVIAINPADPEPTQKEVLAVEITDKLPSTEIS